MAAGTLGPFSPFSPWLCTTSGLKLLRLHVRQTFEIEILYLFFVVVKHQEQNAITALFTYRNFYFEVFEFVRMTQKMLSTSSVEKAITHPPVSEAENINIYIFSVLMCCSAWSSWCNSLKVEAGRAWGRRQNWEWASQCKVGNKPPKAPKQSWEGAS